MRSVTAVATVVGTCLLLSPTAQAGASDGSSNHGSGSITNSNGTTTVTGT
jgi:hypothetical protein